jgi:hypothetical protein
MLRSLSCVTSLALVGSALSGAQQSPPDTVRTIAALHQTLVDRGATIGPRIWPDFRPDTIATHYVIPRRAKLFAQWRDTLPTGFFRLPNVHATAWTDTRAVSFPRGRPIAFLSVDSTSSPGSVLGLALHEQFHAFQQAVARPDRRFGAGENSMLVATYPSFDVANEAAVALEGRLLARALQARTRRDAQRLAREFLAVRETRHARLDSTFVQFEIAGELNEGLSQYAMLRGLRELARTDRRFAAAAAAEERHERALLDSLLDLGPRSIRRRFYATGSAIAMLLDWISDSSWKTRLVRDDATLQQMLAAASGYRGRAALGAVWSRQADAELARLRTDAERSVAALDRRRVAQRDSIVGQPGLRLVVDPAALRGRRLDWCFFDPQNVLMTSAGELLHMRLLRACAGNAATVEFDQPVAEDRATGILRTVIDSTTMSVTSAGAAIPLPADGSTIEVSQLRVASPRVTLSAARATMTRRGSELRITPSAAP